MIVQARVDSRVPKKPGAIQPTIQELDELEELRRFSAELREPEPLSMTSTV